MQDTLSDRYREYSIIRKSGLSREQIYVFILLVMPFIPGTDYISKNRTVHISPEQSNSSLPTYHNYILFGHRCKSETFIFRVTLPNFHTVFQLCFVERVAAPCSESSCETHKNPESKDNAFDDQKCFSHSSYPFIQICALAPRL